MQHRCSCGKVLPYDGAEAGILNLNSRELFSHKLLRWFREAWLNYIALQQIDYSNVFSCKCPDQERNQCLIADGIILGTTRNMEHAPLLYDFVLYHLEANGLASAARSMLTTAVQKAANGLVPVPLKKYVSESAARQAAQKAGAESSARNAKLALLKSHCAYMSQPMFLLYLRFFLYVSANLRG
ncbi:hypothetical protein PLESTM_001018100 [Pleodorina starrii]|nr:hypothetical protein PLESTM_001018100 [Pleodorina starrii]